MILCVCVCKCVYLCEQVHVFACGMCFWWDCGCAGMFEYVFTGLQMLGVSGQLWMLLLSYFSLSLFVCSEIVSLTGLGLTNWASKLQRDVHHQH